MAVIDIIVICVLAFFGIVGMVKGFLNTIISLFGNLASLAVAILCVKPVSLFLNKIFGIVPNIGASIAKSLTSITPFQTGNTSGNTLTELSGEGLKKYLENDGLSFQERVFNLFIEDSKQFTMTDNNYAAADASVTKYIGERIASVISILIAVVAMFIILRIAVLLLAKLFDALTKNRAIGGFDRATGLLFGLFKGVLLVCIVLGIFYLIANTTVNGWVENSVVTNWIYNYVAKFINFIATKYNLPQFITNLFPVLSA